MATEHYTKGSGGADSHGSHDIAIAIPREEKKIRLARMSESDFRDRIVRPLFLALKYRDGRDLHGPDEDGKDIVFIEDDKFGGTRVVCVQTKKGNLNMSSAITKNIGIAVTQLKMALEAPVSLLESREKRHVDEVVLCASGKINKRATEHIVSELQNRGIRFLDAESIIDLIDQHHPLLWQGISFDLFAHYDAIRKHVEHEASDIIAPSAASDNVFVQLTFYRNKAKRVRYNHRVRNDLYFEELRVHELIGLPNDIILIVGDAGSGKSTALWRIAYEIVRRDRGKGQIIPVILSAREVNLKEPESSDFVSQIKYLSKKLSSVSDLFTEDDLKHGRIALLVDGIDEVTDTKQRRSLYEALIDFRFIYPGCTIIVTTRPDIETESTFKKRGARVYRIAPISWSQVKKIVKQVLSNRPLKDSQLETVTRGAQRVLRQIEEVHGFQLTPLLAAVYAASAEYSRSDVPANITEVFKKYSELMLGRWDERKGLGQQIHAPLKDFLLKKIAYGMHKEKRLYIAEEEFSDRVNQVLKELGHSLDINEIKDELLNRSRLLRTRGQEVGFAHLLLQEFFAGREIPEPEVMSYIDDRWWTKSIVFYYGDKADRAGHLRRVQEQIMGRTKQNPVAYRAIGLALQASYLSPVSIKAGVWLDVIIQLSKFMEDSIKGSEQSTLFPMIETTFGYLEYRDAVPFAALGDETTRDQVLRSIEAKVGCDDVEAWRFWYVIALLEGGFVDTAYRFLRGYRFREQRYYLWIIMGASFIAGIVPASPDDKTIARKICMEYQDEAARFIDAFFKEYRRTLLVEKRGDSVVDLADEDDQKK